jgi:hypothetical protein
VLAREASFLYSIAPGAAELARNRSRTFRCLAL